MRGQMDALDASIRACLTEEVASVRQTVERKVDEIRFDAIMQLAPPSSKSTDSTLRIRTGAKVRQPPGM